jgi:protein-L-isoaspartate(D-aspartate) O-methyltransferase
MFVPQDRHDRAYDDAPLTIGYGQTISQPTVVALMTDALHPTSDDVVLEVGTGSGYQAAVLSRMVKRVETIEIVEPLAAHAREALRKIGCANVNVHVGDGYQGLPQLAPFDGIIVTAAPPEVPTKLVQQLKEGGRMVLPVGPRLGVQELVLIRKMPGGVLKRTDLGPVRFVPMVHADE